MPRRSRSALPSVAASVVANEPHLVFRNTAVGPELGRVALSALGDPAGPRALTELTCDRVFAAGGRTLCLSSDPGIVTTYSAAVYDDATGARTELPLTGSPSRARLSGTAAWRRRRASSRVTPTPRRRSPPGRWSPTSSSGEELRPGVVHSGRRWPHDRPVGPELLGRDLRSRTTTSSTSPPRSVGRHTSRRGGCRRVRSRRCAPTPSARRCRRTRPGSRTRSEGTEPGATGGSPCSTSPPARRPSSWSSAASTTRSSGSTTTRHLRAPR